MKRTPRIPRLRTIVCESHKVLAHVRYKPTTLSAVESDVATT